MAKRKENTEPILGVNRINANSIQDDNRKPGWGISKNVYEYHLSNLDDDRKHFPFALESAIFQAMAEGDYDKVEKIVKEVLLKTPEKIGVFAISPLKQAEYTAVLAAGYCCVLAIECGVNQYVSYDISDTLLQRISAASSEAAYTKLIFEVLRTYCDLIKKSKHSTSLHTKSCKQYIYQHLTETCSLSDIASHLHLNPTYLSGLFRKNEGITIKEFILREKISAAQDMLRHTNAPVSEIADRFCFSSQSYFSQVFRKNTGMTPLQYRASRKADSAYDFRSFHADT